MIQFNFLDGISRQVKEFLLRLYYKTQEMMCPRVTLNGVDKLHEYADIL